MVGFGNGCFERTSLTNSFPNYGGGFEMVRRRNGWQCWCKRTSGGGGGVSRWEFDDVGVKEKES